jgi:hypothetical protein
MKLFYFDIYGAAEFARMSCAYAKCPLENVFITEN